MFSLDIIRGPHSSGVMTMERNGNLHVAKEVGTPYNLYPTKEYKDATKYLSKVIACHNRHATVGGVNKENAHPFVTDNLVGMHNGTLRNIVGYDKFKSFSTDSEALFNSIDERGLKETLKNTNGAYALVWLEKDTHALNFVRNGDRPLYYAYSKDSSVLFWASEDWMIHVACGRSGYEIGKIYQLPTYQHMRIDLNGFKAYNRDPIGNIKSSPVPKYEPPFQRYTSKVTHSKGTTKKVHRGVSIPMSFVGSTVKARSVYPVTTSNTSYLRFMLEDKEDVHEIRAYAEKDGELWKEVMASGVGTYYSMVIKKVTKPGSGLFSYMLAKVSSVERCLAPTEEETNEKKPPGSGGTGSGRPSLYLVHKDKEEVEETQDEEELEDQFYPWHNNMMAPAETILRKGRMGCAQCGNPVNLNDAVDYVWINSETYFCGECKDTPFAEEYILH